MLLIKSRNDVKFHFFSGERLKFPTERGSDKKQIEKKKQERVAVGSRTTGSRWKSRERVSRKWWRITYELFFSMFRFDHSFFECFCGLGVQSRFQNAGPIVRMMSYLQTTRCRRRFKLWCVYYSNTLILNISNSTIYSFLFWKIDTTFYLMFK